MMALKRRVEQLEAKLGGTTPEPLVALFRVEPARADMRVTGDEGRKRHARFAIIGAGQLGEAMMLRIGDEESESTFLLRVEAETIRIHGRLPMDWKPACTVSPNVRHQQAEGEYLGGY